jgi:hypothetical protein
MLAYAFWHWRRPGVERDEYEALQRAFHAALAQSPPTGFVSSRCSAIRAAPWAAEGAEAYEDWYLLTGSAALDPLNDAAVSASRRGAHDAAAAAAQGGTAGLYRLRRGTPLAAPGVAVWFAKPPGTTYAALYDALDPLLRSGSAALWGRQMTLGPTPEFCLHSERPIPLPDLSAAGIILLRPVWPEPIGGAA